MNLLYAVALIAIAATLAASLRWALFTEDLPLTPAALRCLFRWHHNPARRAGGGFRCLDCGFLGADLDELGFEGSGYVSLTARPIYDRDSREWTRTTAWSRGERGW